ncbi:MAG TPA: hypothetical protein VIA45_02050, partial [Thermoanaerobaculia bacterium]
MRPAVLILSGLAIALSPRASLAQAPPLSTDLQVNTYTGSINFFPAVSSPGDGSFVVVWENGAEDGSGAGIFGQRFDISGHAVGGEFPVNTYTTGGQFIPQVGSDASGDFVVVWYGPGSSAAHFAALGQRFDAAGAKLGPEFVGGLYTTANDEIPSIAVGPAGDFVVVWTDGSDPVPQQEVFGQRFDASGVKVGPRFHVNTYTTGEQDWPSVAMDRSGGFVVVWMSEGQDGYGAGVFGQRFDASGARLGTEFQVNTHTAGAQQFPRVAVDRRDNFVVVWRSLYQDGSESGVFGQRFDGSGEKVGPELQINTYTTGSQSAPAIAIGPRGDFVVVWESYQDGYGDGIFGQRFDRAGRRLGVEFQVNSHASGGQYDPTIADDGRGFVVAWRSVGPEVGADIGIISRRQTFVPDGLTVDAHGNGGTSDLNGVMEP